MVRIAIGSRENGISPISLKGKKEQTTSSPRPSPPMGGGEGAGAAETVVTISLNRALDGRDRRKRCEFSLGRWVSAKISTRFCAGDNALRLGVVSASELGISKPFQFGKWFSTIYQIERVLGLALVPHQVF
jgi:hypothetical protein